MKKNEIVIGIINEAKPDRNREGKNSRNEILSAIAVAVKKGKITERSASILYLLVLRTEQVKTKKERKMERWQISSHESLVVVKGLHCFIVGRRREAPLLAFSRSSGDSTATRVRKTTTPSGISLGLGSEIR